MRDDVIGSDIFAEWELSAAPETFPVGRGSMGAIEIAPKRLVVVGGATSAGKSALVQQWAFDALRLNPELRCAICSVEMSPPEILDRQLSRLSGVLSERVQKRHYDREDLERIAAAREPLRALSSRLLFIRKSYTVDHIADKAKAFGARLIVLDYLQKLESRAAHSDLRSAMNSIMAGVRQMADDGAAVVAVSALARPKDSSEPAGIHSLRESGAIEYDSDHVFLLTTDDETGAAVLRHLKARHAKRRDVHLLFNPNVMSFTTDGQPHSTT